MDVILQRTEMGDFLSSRDDWGRMGGRGGYVTRNPDWDGNKDGDDEDSDDHGDQDEEAGGDESSRLLLNGGGDGDLRNFQSANMANSVRKLRSSKVTSISTKFESLDYDILENDIYVKDQAKIDRKHYVRLEAARWLVMFFVGVLTAVVAFLIDYCLTQISSVKFGWISDSITRCVDDECLDQSVLLWMGIDIFLVSIACLLVLFVEPIAQGSGIPEIKCYLNGIKIPHVVRFKALLTKTVGVLFSVSGGLACGKEGPMIHTGSVIAAGISQGKSTTFNIDLNLFKAFRTDHEKRDFVSGGAAAGVSAAFGAPIGGVLFSLEEGASFWNQALTWRIFFCSMIASFTLNVLLSGTKGTSWGAMSSPGLVNFGAFASANYNLFELPIFIAMGAVAGLFGALFNALNHRLTVFRFKYIYHSKALRFLEVILVAAATVIVSFTLIYFDDNCLPLGEKPGENPLEFFCQEHTYNEIATMLFNTPEESIKNLFHATRGDYSPETLSIFFLVMFCLSCWTYGISVPAGVFVPALLTGAAYGRLVGNLLYHAFPDADWVDPGKYALIGAASMLGGIVRMTISLTVIVVEGTGNISYGLPLMLSIMAAKLVGDLFNEGIYDLHIHLRRVPILHWEAPLPMQHFHASHVMSSNVVCIQEFDRVGRIVELLRTTTHNAFPVVTDDGIQRWRQQLQQRGGAAGGLPLGASTMTSGSAGTAGGSSGVPRPSASSRMPNINLNASVMNFNMSTAGHMMGIDIVRAPAGGQLSTLGTSYGSTSSGNTGASGNDWGAFPPESQYHVNGAAPTTAGSTPNTASPSAVPLPPFLNLNVRGPYTGDSASLQHAPLVNEHSYGTLCGIILRSQLITILKERAFGPRVVNAQGEHSVQAKVLTVDDFRASYPRYPSIDTISTTAYENEQFMDLRPYLNPTPYTLKHAAPLSRVYRIFRGLGLRHLIITDRFNQVVGMITRKDLTRFEIVPNPRSGDGTRWILQERQMIDD
ncbi:voltage gated chloride channel protein, variant [Capsaspora owczarzaki ATCC 30864]|uniref:Chloride channel protein n=1 Tax=Capsaspora owczarzaki (strain ATCC 30864) TaxID=595528 RepID=A0A0D2UDJ0_CAPO3|nr:voltage gated chloride channel protein, variant [Capsaspora owczarzaki ATCC 30864]